MATDKCYTCYDYDLFSELGPSADYYRLRELYEVNSDDEPFTCTSCGCKVDPKKY